MRFTAIKLAVFSVVFLDVSVGALFAQELFNPKMLPRDWMSPSLLKPRLKDLAGPDAVNCGRASQSSIKAADVSDCALQAFGSRKSFYARYDLQAIDSVLVVGFAFDGQKVYAVTWENMVGWAASHTLDVKECPSPTTLSKLKSGRLNCFAPDSNGNSSIMLPQLEPY